MSAALETFEVCLFNKTAEDPKGVEAELRSVFEGSREITGFGKGKGEERPL